jgi:hypothetical protein
MYQCIRTKSNTKKALRSRLGGALNILHALYGFYFSYQFGKQISVAYTYCQMSLEQAII